MFEEPMFALVSYGEHVAWDSFPLATWGYQTDRPGWIRNPEDKKSLVSFLLREELAVADQKRQFELASRIFSPVFVLFWPRHRFHLLFVPCFGFVPLLEFQTCPPAANLVPNLQWWSAWPASVASFAWFQQLSRKLGCRTYPPLVVGVRRVWMEDLPRTIVFLVASVS